MDKTLTLLLSSIPQHSFNDLLKELNRKEDEKEISQSKFNSAHMFDIIAKEYLKLPDRKKAFEGFTECRAIADKIISQNQ